MRRIEDTKGEIEIIERRSTFAEKEKEVDLKTSENIQRL